MSDETEETRIDVGDREAVREGRRNRRLEDIEEGHAVTTLMSRPAGRRFMYDLLESCHIYATSYSDNASRMAFQEGERNVGLRLVAVIQRACAHHYNSMIEEANERSHKSEPRKPASKSASSDFDPTKPFGGFDGGST